jgi:hypothetical protein
MNYRRATLAAFVYALLWVAFSAAILPALASARPVNLTDATYAPSRLVYLQPHMAATFDVDQCPRGTYFSEVSAYRWNGHALSAQRWNADHTVTYWSYGRERITFDGITFRNATHHHVLVAGWCE